jgi:hypothetical protein
MLPASTPPDGFQCRPVGFNTASVIASPAPIPPASMLPDGFQCRPLPPLLHRLHQSRPHQSRPPQCRPTGFNAARFNAARFNPARFNPARFNPARFNATSIIAYCLKELKYVNIYCSEISFGIYRVPPVLDTLSELSFLTQNTLFLSNSLSHWVQTLIMIDF